MIIAAMTLSDKSAMAKCTCRPLLMIWPAYFSPRLAACRQSSHRERRLRDVEGIFARQITNIFKASGGPAALLYRPTRALGMVRRASISMRWHHPAARAAYIIGSVLMPMKRDGVVGDIIVDRNYSSIHQAVA